MLAAPAHFFRASADSAGAFASGPDEIEAVAAILEAAKCEAIERWQLLRSESLRN